MEMKVIVNLTMVLRIVFFVPNQQRKRVVLAQHCTRGFG